MPAEELLREYGEDAAWMFSELQQLVEQLPMAERVEADVIRFIEAGPRVPTTLRSLRDDPICLQVLVQLAVTSKWAMELLRIMPGFFWTIMSQRDHRQVYGRALLTSTILGQIERMTEDAHRVNVLVRFNQYHLLRILIGDLSGDLTFESVCNEIADIADATIEASLHLAQLKYRQRYGEPTTRFVVYGMGKLGGRELNYSSDIDLIFAYEGRGETTGGRKDIDHHFYFVKVGAEIIRLLGEQHEAGRMYRVDMRLRPEGASGELVHNRREVVDYYYTVGRPWERQALIKCRPVAGSIAFGHEILGDLRPWIYPVDQSTQAIDETRIMRRRIEERAQEANIKTGAGGIRDIEFLVQFFQTLYGGRLRALRLPATLPVLEVLTDQKLLPRTDAEELADHYRWLRKVEHRLQVFQMRQLHDVPDDPDERLDLAYRCGYAGSEALTQFSKDLNHCRARVRRLADKHYLDSDPTYDGFFALLGSEDPSVALRDEVLKPYGFKNIGRAHDRLSHMAREPFFILSRGRTIKHLCLLLPELLERLSRSPDPDAALANMQRLVDAVGGRSAFYDQLLRRPRLLDTITALCGWSSYVVEEMTRFTGLPDDLAERMRGGRRRIAHEDLEQEGANLIQGLQDPVPPLAYMKAREQVLICADDLSGADELAVWFHLSTLARSVMRVVVDRAIAEMAERWGLPKRKDGSPARFAVLGCGKLGSGELSYASDMDVLFVADLDASCDNGREAQVFWERVVRRLVRYCHNGQLYEVDPRLRPWGDQGPIVVGLSMLMKYWSEPRELWERMAMTRIAPVAGDGELGLAAARLIRGAALTLPVPEDAAQQTRDMRARLEESVSGRDHIKRGPGGYVDIEFLVHYLSMGCDPDSLPAGAPILDTLWGLVDVGRLPAAAIDDCREGYLILRRVESRMRLMEGRAVSSIPTEVDRRQFFARCCDYASREELDFALHLAREHNRRWFDELVV